MSDVPQPLPAMCVEGASYDRFAVFKELKFLWFTQEEAAGRRPSNKSLSEELSAHYATIQPQRTSQWATGTDPGSVPPDHVIMYLCWKLGIVLVFAPDGVSLHKAAAR